MTLPYVSVNGPVFSSPPNSNLFPSCIRTAPWPSFEVGRFPLSRKSSPSRRLRRIPLSRRESRLKAITMAINLSNPPVRSLVEKFIAEDTRMTEWFAW